MNSWTDYFFGFIEKHGVKMVEKQETLEEFIARTMRERDPNWTFKPYAFYNETGDQIHICWADEQDYVEELKGRQTHPTEGWPYSVMGLHKSMETHIPTGVTLYSIKQILKEAGFELVPIKKEEE